MKFHNFLNLKKPYISNQYSLQLKNKSLDKVNINNSTVINNYIKGRFIKK